MPNFYTQDYFDNVSWTPITPNTGWDRWAEYWTPAGYARIGALVMLRGVLRRSSGDSDEPITLPAAIAPAINVRHDFFAWNGAEREANTIYITPTGACTLQEPYGSTTGVVVNFDGAIYLAGK